MGANASSVHGAHPDAALEAYAAQIPRFSHQEIVAATASFSSANILGAGTSGEVYRGRLHGTADVAVKVLQGGFLDELKVLSRFRHPNIIALLGWAAHDVLDDKYIVYELLAGGDVGKRLYKCKRGRQPFPGQHRACVALDVSCGLAFMMNNHPKTFHRDIKPSNILLDNNGTAKLADFGLAGSIKDEGEECLSFEDVMGGTPGYICPEYSRTGEVTEQSEVYSFGITILELLMNELPARAGPNGGLCYPIVEAVRPAESGALARVVAKLDQTGAWPRPTADEIARLALRCVHSRSIERPLFAELVLDLRGFCQPFMEPIKVGCTSPRTCTLPAGFMGGPSAIGTQQLPSLAANAANAIHAAHAQQAHKAQVQPQAGGARGSTPPVTPSARRSPASSPQNRASPSSFPQNNPRHESDWSIGRAISDPNGVCGYHNAHNVPPTPRLQPRPGDTPVAPGRPPSINGMHHRRVPSGDSSEALTRTPSINGMHHRRVPSGDSSEGFTRILHHRRVPSKESASGFIHETSARLTCSFAKGTQLSELPPQTRSVALGAGEAVELGRQRMPGFFERLLAGDTQWLGFISRAHCRLQLVPVPPGSSPANRPSPPALKVENLSANTIYVCGRAVNKGQSDVMPTGGTLEFAAKQSGSGEWTGFLTFTLEN